MSKNKSYISKFFNVILKDKKRKSVIRMVWEVLRLFISDRAFPYHYFSRFLYRKDIEFSNDFVSNKILYSLWPIFNDKSFIPYADNKLLFSEYFSSYGINVVKNILFNNKNLFIKQDKIIVINSIDQFKELMKDILDNYSNTKTIFIKKCYGSYGGESTYKLTGDMLNTDNPYLNVIYKDIISSSFVFQDSIIQHPQVNKLNSSCVNTLRIDTFENKNGEIKVISALLRFGLEGAYIDNTSSGGCQVGIDLKTGMMDKLGFSTITDGEGIIYTEHPDSGIPFEGFEIPYFDKALELVTEAASYLPGLRLVGWDVAIEKSGPILIEANHDYDMTGTDMALGGCKKSKVFQEILKEANN